VASGMNDWRGLLIVLGWLLSPVAIIVGTVAIVALIEAGRRSIRRVRRREPESPAAPANSR
jgi:hypothetical protein